MDQLNILNLVIRTTIIPALSCSPSNYYFNKNDV